MTRGSNLLLLLGFMTCAFVNVTFARENEPASNTGKVEAISVTSKPTPSVVSIEGFIEALDFQSPIPSLRMTSKDGQVLTIQINRQSTIVWKGRQRRSLDDVKVGSQVKVRCIQRHGVQVAKTIDLI